VLDEHKALTTLFPRVDPKVETLLEGQGNALLGGSLKYVDLVVDALIAAERKCEEKERLSTRCGIPPGDPYFKEASRLEGLIDWYVSEVKRLTRVSDGLATEVNRWRSKAEALQTEQPQQSAGTKYALRQNRLLECAAQHMRPGRDSPSGWPLAGFGQRSTSLDSQKGQAAKQRNRKGAALREGAAPMTARSVPSALKNPAAGTGNGASGSSTARANSRTPRQQSQAKPLIASGELALQRRPGNKDGRTSERKLGTDPANTAVSVSGRTSRRADAIAKLEGDLRRAKEDVRNAKTQNARRHGRKRQLEEFFLHCMHDLKTDVMRKRDLAEAPLGSNRSYQQEMMSMDSRACQSEAEQRQQVVQVLVGSEDLLVLLYEELFPHRRPGYMKDNTMPEEELNEATLKTVSDAPWELVFK